MGREMLRGKNTPNAGDDANRRSVACVERRVEIICWRNNMVNSKSAQNGAAAPQPEPSQTEPASSGSPDNWPTKQEPFLCASESSIYNGNKDAQAYRRAGYSCPADCGVSLKPDNPKDTKRDQATKDFRGT